MSNSSAIITQVRDKEAEMSKMLEKEEKKNNERVISAGEETVQLVGQADTEARQLAGDEIGQAKEAAKKDFKKIMVDGDNERRDIVESGKGKLDKAKKIVMDALEAMF